MNATLKCYLMVIISVMLGRKRRLACVVEMKTLQVIVWDIEWDLIKLVRLSERRVARVCGDGALCSIKGVLIKFDKCDCLPVRTACLQLSAPSFFFVVKGLAGDATDAPQP